MTVADLIEYLSRFDGREGVRHAAHELEDSLEPLARVFGNYDVNKHTVSGTHAASTASTWLSDCWVGHNA